MAAGLTGGAGLFTLGKQKQSQNYDLIATQLAQSNYPSCTLVMGPTLPTKLWRLAAVSSSNLTQGNRGAAAAAGGLSHDLSQSAGCEHMAAASIL